jgi:hypothetical protein
LPTGGEPEVDQYSRAVTGSSSSPPNRATNARVVVRDDFLPAQTRSEVERGILTRECEFVSSRVTLPGSVTGDGEKAGSDIELRRSRVIVSPGPALRSMFVPHLTKAILAASALTSDEPDAVNRPTSGQGALALSKIEIQLTASGDGDFYGLHVDGGPNRYSHRDISFVYFVCTDPGCLTGGELHLVDEKPAAVEQTIEPLDNRLVMFPSRRRHEIRQVGVPSLEFRHSRFTVNGWVSFTRQQS